MVKRFIAKAIQDLSKQYPVLALVGPRQSGKTTLSRNLFPKHRYLSLENPDLRRQAEDDPRGFFHDYGNKLILDEIQRVPSLFSYLQQRVDEDSSPGQYILTGSHQFLLMEKISQTLAGRIVTFKIYPFTFSELWQRKCPTTPDRLLTSSFESPGPSFQSLEILLLSGLYPRIHDKKLAPQKWIEEYISTYVERDVRLLVNVVDLRQFESFLKLCASYSGQLVNFSAIGSAIGASQPTVKKWLSLLEASGIVFLLPPYYRNFKKRIVRSPKLYFLDTGLLCFLLGIRAVKELRSHPLYGSVFETFIISEIFKSFHHLGVRADMYFWRDKMGREIDLLLELGTTLIPVEIKSSKTYSKTFKDTLNQWMHLTKTQKGIVIYDGEDIVGKTTSIPTFPWWTLAI